AGELRVFRNDEQHPVDGGNVPGQATFDVVQGDTYYVAVTGAHHSTGSYVLTFDPLLGSSLGGTLAASGTAALPPSLLVPPQLADRLDADAGRDGFTPALVPLSVDRDGRLTATLQATDGSAFRLSLFDKDGNLLVQSVGRSPADGEARIVQQ